jgi:hypothetical protein
MIRTIGIGILVTLLNVQAWAADVPKTISYSGKYVHADGSPMPDGVYDLLFSLYETQTGGAPVWQELHRQADKNGVVVNKGSFAVVLGNQTPLPVFDKNYYVAVSNPQTRQEVVGRNALGSSPYALAIAPEIDLPIGSIIAWHKSLTGTPQVLPNKWVECNGQMIDDPESLYCYQVIPNLNGHPGTQPLAIVDNSGTTINSTYSSAFLRGGICSGEGQIDTFQGHWHYLENGNLVRRNVPGYNTSPGGSGWCEPNQLEVKFATNDDLNGEPRTGKETRPVNMSVVWIMKVK